MQFHNKNKLATCIALALGLSAAQAQAFEGQEGSAALLLEMSLDELINIPVTTASRKAESRDQSAAHIMVVTREQIRQRRYKNLADLLEDMPGVDFQRGTKSSQFNQFTVQGHLGPNRLLVMMDGVRINHPGGGNYQVAENLALYSAKQVEFLYGPAAALYGADAVSGVVNIITEAGNGEDGAWVSLGAGRFGSKEASFMSGYNGEGPLRFSAGAHVQESDRADLSRYYPDKFKKVDGVNYDGSVAVPANQRESYRGDISSYSLFARADFEERFTLGYFRHQFTNLTSTVDPYVTAIYSKAAKWQGLSDTVYGKYRFELHEDLSGELKLEYSRLEVDPGSHYNGVDTRFRPLYSYSFAERTSIEQSFDWRINQTHQLQAGLGYQFQKAIEAGSMPRKYNTSKGPDSQGMIYPGTTLNMPILHGRRYGSHAYSQLLSQWTDTFSTTAGLRYDNQSKHGESYNPRVGAVWKPVEKHLFKLMYAQAYREPSSEEAMAYYGDIIQVGGNYVSTSGSFYVPNGDLKPEKSKTVSFVWEWRPTRKLNLMSNLYASRVTDLITGASDLPDNTSFMPGATLEKPRSKTNAGRQKNIGLDLAAQWRFMLNDSWTGDLWGSASWIKGRLTSGETDLDIPYVATYKLKLGTTFKYEEKYSITPKLRWTGKVTNHQTKAPNTTIGMPSASCDSQQTAPKRCTTPGYTLVDLHLGRHNLINDHLTLWLDVYNLTDRRYYAAAGSGSRTFWDMPQQPRTWMLSADWRF